MVGRHHGFIALLKKEVPGILALNDRLFGQLCKENDEEINRLLLHTEVRWLPKRTCLTRFSNLFNSVLEFREEKDVALRDRVLQFKMDVAYMTNLFTKFNGINLQLQGKELNLIITKSVLSAFLKRLTLWKQNFGRNEFSQFSILSDMHKSSEIPFDETQAYCQHLESLHKDFSERFKDSLSLEVPQWVMNPFMNIETAELLFGIWKLLIQKTTKTPPFAEVAFSKEGLNVFKRRTQKK
ncbi:hypothetical protein JRQ81_012121 [Phrynocephalus forsythii]|uniref:Uncharacterized protein n=1 Tax=Phrynocephalus forsythii TaxID=171643 RepID=A0A9Q0X5D9_9SAUR|nr:hypothetical protein JRQ81_012121 [Phrynocephalus forsythii]